MAVSSEEHALSMERALSSKFAIWVVCDQTIAYMDEGGGITTQHCKAHLFLSYAEATNALDTDGWRDGGIEEVLNEKEFCSREDTW